MTHEPQNDEKHHPSNHTKRWLSDPTRVASHLKKSLRRDRIAKLIITSCGLSVIVAVFGIIFLIFKEVVPLFSPANKSKVEIAYPDLRAFEPAAISMGGYLETYALVGKSGQLRFYNMDGTQISFDRSTLPQAKEVELLSARFYGSSLSMVWEDGSGVLMKVSFIPRFPKNQPRTIEPTVKIIHEFPPLDKPPKAVYLRKGEGQLTRFAIFQDRSHIYEVTPDAEEEDDLFGDDDSSPVSTSLPIPSGQSIVKAALSNQGELVIASLDNGKLMSFQWDSDSESFTKRSFEGLDSEVTGLGYSYGDRSILVATADKKLSSWQLTRSENHRKWLKTKTFPDTMQSIRWLSHSYRDKTLLTLDQGGTARLYYLTSETQLLEFDQRLKLVTLAPRNNGLLGVNEQNQLIKWKLDLAHPEVTLGTLLSRVWYLDYNEPDLVWQSTGGSDEYEPKLSIVPLVFGTLKGTFYSLVFALPLSLLGAIYLSQFASKRIKGMVKPIIELMAALPSVVIGFLAALWLAPFLEQALTSMGLFMILFPILLFCFLTSWPFLRALPLLRPFERGYEFIILIPIFVIAWYAAQMLAPGVEQQFFDGSLTSWIFQNLGMSYDSRNSIVISFALGLTVIPIILSISEDSLSSVPPALSASSLALGASRWQTVWRLIVPSALPGIFAATMIGIGRAIGETMIVLMATGNTPIMDPSPLNGFRTLAANIAVEIAEAPVGGSLYRTLFLCAVILFCLTFVLNTTSELVRQSLRNKYGKF